MTIMSGEVSSVDIHYSRWLVLGSWEVSPVLVSESPHGGFSKLTKLVDPCCKTPKMLLRDSLDRLNLKYLYPLRLRQLESPMWVISGRGDLRPLLLLLLEREWVHKPFRLCQRG
jgi:hypothetical protein